VFAGSCGIVWVRRSRSTTRPLGVGKAKRVGGKAKQRCSDHSTLALCTGARWSGPVFGLPRFQEGTPHFAVRGSCDSALAAGRSGGTMSMRGK